MTRPDRSVPSTTWLDLLKAVALLWIFLNHVVERVIDSPYISNPNSDWPSLSERVRQLTPVDFGATASDVVMNLLRYLGWAGDQGVQLFLIASGFGLTWSFLKRGSSPGWMAFFHRRLWRIFPLWWGAHLMFLLLSIFVGGRGINPFDPRFYLSLAGFRASSGMMYYFSPAWWYIGLMIQLYVVFPLLADWLRRLGPGRFLGFTLLTSFAARLVGLYAFDHYLDAWSRGGIFITRLPEFAFGMALAWWVFERPGSTDRFLRRPSTLALALVAYLIATGLALTLWGMAFAPFLHGVASFVWIYSLVHVIAGLSSWFVRMLVWIGAFSYSIYLTHHPVIAFLMERQEQPTMANIAMGVPVFGVALGLAFLLERTVGKTLQVITEWTRARGSRWVAKLLAILTVGLVGVVLGAEVAVRTLDPQEINGWGERASLEPNDDFGWRLVPDSTTRLRWESYDYTVQANALGFPGPLYDEQAPPGTIRIMTLGDAFTSAEGVDTDRSWPRLLETSLNEMINDARIEVLNFAITGYGPNQYAAVLEAYGPRFRPDVVLVGFFVNEYGDVQTSNEAFRLSIGFDAPAQDSPASYLEGAHLRRWLQLNVTQPLRERATGQPRFHGYFLGNFDALEIAAAKEAEPGHSLVRDRLSEMKALADSIGSHIILALIPAPVQICGPDDLVYYPRNVHLDDSARYDIDRPQQLTRQICEDLGITTYDLREPLSALESCPYQPRNMHWLPAGHQAVAEFLADALEGDDLLMANTRPEREKE